MVMMSQFLPLGEFKWIDPKNYGSNKYSSNSSKSCVLGFYLEYPTELRELPYPLTPDKIESKKEMLSNYQVKIAGFYNFPIGNFKTFLPNIFDKEKYMLHYENLELYLKLGLKLKKYIVNIAKTICQI